MSKGVKKLSFSSVAQVTTFSMTSSNVSVPSEGAYAVGLDSPVQVLERTLSNLEGERDSSKFTNKDRARKLTEKERKEIWGNVHASAKSHSSKLRNCKKIQFEADHEDLEKLRQSRNETGCSCARRGKVCNSETCSCFANEIAYVYVILQIDVHFRLQLAALPKAVAHVCSEK
jgi:hypothetical protein